VKLLDARKTADKTFLVMDLCQGGELYNQIGKVMAPSVRRCVLLQTYLTPITASPIPPEYEVGVDPNPETDIKAHFFFRQLLSAVVGCLGA
jgi:hypothetical protein